jgi:glyoxylase-like metal-dependent hydrolase (beta-lactamase superfamily II)
MIFEQIRTAGDRNFSYLVGDEASKEAALVDPGYLPEMLVERVRDHGLRLVFVLNTHGHPDHTGGNDAVRGLTGARLVAFGRGDLPVRHGDRFRVGRLEITALHTPGHTEDSVCFLVQGKLFTGDTLFVGKVGGTGDRRSARLEYDALRQVLGVLPPETEVWPGHDYGVRPSSTIGDELRENPFLLRDSFESFCELKDNWLEYKRTHGIQ